MPNKPFTSSEIIPIALATLALIFALAALTDNSGDLTIDGDLQASGLIYSNGQLVRTFDPQGFTGNCTILGLTRIEVWNGTVVNCV